MKIEIGKLRKIPSGTKFWCIPLQNNISLDKDVVVKIEQTYNDKDNYFYGKLQEIYFEHCGIPGIADKANGDIGIEFDKTIPYELPDCKYPEPNCDPITYNECIIDGKIYKYDGCSNINLHSLDESKIFYSKLNCNYYIGCGKIYTIKGIHSNDNKIYHFFVVNKPTSEETSQKCIIDGKIYKYDECLNVNNHVLEDCKEYYSKKNCNYIGCGKIHSVCGIPSKNLNTYYFFANIPEPEKGIFDDVLDDIFKLAEKYKKYR